MIEDIEVRLLLSAGRGPVECAWAVVRLARRLEQDAVSRGLTVRRIDAVEGPEPGTLASVLLGLAGAGVEDVVQAWSGTLCWQATSPYRPRHPRKNWFVAARRLEAEAARRDFCEDDVHLVPCRTGGPGGQHRNKASTAVRATHRPTGIVVVVDDERRSADNRRLALDLLRRRIEEAYAASDRAADAARWVLHDQLVRGNPTRVERPR